MKCDAVLSGSCASKFYLSFLSSEPIDICVYEYMCVYIYIYKQGKAAPLQAWSGPESSRKLRFPVYMTTAQDGGKVVRPTHRPPLPPGNTPGTHFC